ncbi:MAG: hypothetical protein JWN24_1932 [Phycisphaerales bacterium]|nr:hypothetical protein [Phycisphaerales bacterium]
MSEYLNDFSKSFTDEVAATLARIDGLIGDAHWPSVGSYKEGVIRRQLMEYIPGRYTVGTGFVMYLGEVPWRSRQIDILIWDSHNYAPIFRDGPFVVIPPQALRVAIEVKSRLTGTVLRDALENLDSLTQFFPLVAGNHSTDPEARSGFLRFVVAANTNLRFPDEIFRHIYRYYLRCVYDREDPENRAKGQWTMERRLEQTRFWGMTPWISGIAALGAGMVRASRFDEHVGYFVSNDVKADGQDQTIGMIRESIDLFLTTDVLRKARRDYDRTGREESGIVMPVPYSNTVPARSLVKLFDLGTESQSWTLEEAKMAKAKRDEKKMEEAVGNDEAEDSADEPSISSPNDGESTKADPSVGASATPGNSLHSRL